jgi:AAHS family benzoate transporter-like MFS transporter
VEQAAQGGSSGPVLGLKRADLPRRKIVIGADVSDAGGAVPASTSVLERKAGKPINVNLWLESSPLGRFHFCVFFACLILNTMEGYDLYVYGAALPTLMKALGLTEAQAGVIASAASVGTLIGAVIFGPMADKVGRKRIIIWSAALSCVSMTAASLSYDFTTFAGSRLIFGIANGGLVGNLMALASEYIPSRSRATMVGLIAAGSSIGGALGALLGIWMFPEYGWRPVFLVSSALILLLPLYLRWLPEGTSYLARSNRLQQLRAYLRQARPSDPLPDTAELKVEKGKDKVPLTEVFQEGRGTATLRLWACYLCNLYVIHGFTFWLPKMMINRGFTLTQGLTFLLPLALASIIMTFVMGRIADRFGAKPVLAGLYLLSSASIAVLGATQDYVLLMILVGLAGVGFNGAQNMMNSYAPTYYPPSMRSTAMAYNFVAGRVGGIVGPTAVGLLISWHFSFQLATIALALPGVLAALSVSSIPDRYSFTRRLVAGA